MNKMKITFVAFALIVGAVCAHAAGGIKGRPQLQQEADNQQRLLASKGLRPPSQQQQQQLLQPAPQQQPQQQQQLALGQQAIKAGPGQVSPVFTAARIQPPTQQIQQQQQQEPEPEIVQQQQQPAQQQEEIDPNAAAQDSAPAVLAPARAGPAAAAANNEEEANPRPEPYSFQYAFDSGDSVSSGSSTREEQQDASGRVTGFYTLKGEDGRDRRVDYVADASGFRATISTNEMGTAPKDSADVDWNAQNPSEGQLRVAESATQAARARALQNPQQNHHNRQQQHSQQQQQQQPIASASGSSLSSQKFSSPRSKGTSGQQLSKINSQPQQQQQQQQIQDVQQLQEPFEQIRQTEFQTRARKSRHAPFYLYTV